MPTTIEGKSFLNTYGRAIQERVMIERKNPIKKARNSDEEIIVESL
jgi:hypothetical protein